MKNSKEAKAEIEQKARKMALDGKNITAIKEELAISWSEARSYTDSILGSKVRITNRLKRLAVETDQSKREQLAAEADNYVDFLYDAAKHLRRQVDNARKALDR